MNKIPSTTTEHDILRQARAAASRRARRLRNHPIDCKRRGVKHSRFWGQEDYRDWHFYG